MSTDPIDALRAALSLTPENHLLRLMLADTLREAGRPAEALEEYRQLIESGHLPREALIRVGSFCVEVEELELALQCMNQAIYQGVVEGVAELREAIDGAYAERGFVKMRVTPSAAPEAPSILPERQEARLTFSDIGGLAEEKKMIHRTIILPLSRPDLYQAYGRRSGGGILFYGPPGCGKTMLARATATECNLPFLNIRIEEILDPYLGVSERNLHHAFDQARALAPCVLFLDELDALAYARRKQSGSAARSLVDQLLQELDGIGADNQQILVMAATNAPWDIDDALLRPGRFDRRIFVPPPDEPARATILQKLLAARPVEEIRVDELVRESLLFSGADLRALVEQAVDLAIEEALDAGEVRPVTMKHLRAARAQLHPTTLEWLQRAQNYVEFANQDNRYQEVAAFLKSPMMKAWKRGQK